MSQHRILKVTPRRDGRGTRMDIKLRTDAELEGSRQFRRAFKASAAMNARTPVSTHTAAPVPAPTHKPS